MFENGRYWIRKPDRQTVLQRSANKVFRIKTRPGMYEKDMVGQVPQARTQEESLHQGQHRILKSPACV